MSDPSVLSVREFSVGLKIGGGERRLVQSISFDVHQGEILAIVGESGAGKSVAMMGLLSLLPRPPFRVTGQVELVGHGNLLSKTDRQLRGIRGNEIAMVFQDPMLALNPVLGVGSQIAEAIRLHDHRVTRRDARRRATELLAGVEVTDAADRARRCPHEFSGGMQQRAMIAMALANAPRVLIADEPTTALDVTIQAQVLDLLLQMRDRTGFSMVIVTHDLGVVAEIADRVITMYAGEIVEAGGVDEVFAASGHPYTQSLLDSLPTLEGPERRLVSIPGQPPDLAHELEGCRFRPRCPIGRNRERCATEHPSMRDVGSRHTAACHFSPLLGDGAHA
jgi:oligopeptide/dipeptide ABC transporter ATP-binding protein